jgi:hypothetical protein
MESLLIAVLWSALATGASLLVLAALITRRGITALNLTLELPMNPVAVLISQKPQFRIDPTAAGKPEPITELREIAYSVSDANVATVAATSADQSTVELTPVAAGTVTLTVSAKNSAGVVVTDSVTVTFTEPPVDALNLSRTDVA